MAKSVFTNHKLLRYFIFLIIVAVISLGTAIGCYLYFGHSYNASDLNDQDEFSDKLTIGSSFTLDDILDSENYIYTWVKSPNVDIAIYALDNNGNYILTDNVLSYSREDETFNVIGVSEGEIIFTSPIDASVSLSIPFQTRFSETDTEFIIRDNYPAFYSDGIIGADEFNSIEELSFASLQVYNLSDFSNCVSLSRIIVSNPYDVVELQGLRELSSDIIYYVTDGLYDDYMASTTWSSYGSRLFPIVNLAEDYCTVVFEFNGGTMEGMGEDSTHHFESILKGGSINVADYISTKTGYTFLGWYLSNDSGITLSEEVHSDYIFNADTKLYAGWSAIEYDIVYHDNYSTPPTEQHVHYDEIVNLASDILERTGYTFLGWATTEGATSIEYSAGQTVSNLTAIDGAVFNLYSVWAANSYSIIYDANGGINPPEAQEDIAFDMEINLSRDIPTRTGYTFLGWSTSPNATEAEYTAGQRVHSLVSDAEGIVTLYAVWAINTYTIRYDANGGTGAPVDQTGIVYGETVVLSVSVPVWTGHIFLGWSLERNASMATYNAGDVVSNLVADAGQTVTLYAVWEYATFRIQYDANGGTNTPSTSSFVTYNSSFNGITTSTPSRTGYSFVGWSTMPTGNVEYTSGQVLSRSDVNGLYVLRDSNNYVTLYAVWTINSYTITVETSNASVTGVVNGGAYQYNSTISIRISYSEPNERTLIVDGTNLSDRTSYTFSMPAHNITIQAYSSPSCIASGSLITLADGTVTEVENLNVGDSLLVFNHEIGQYDTSYIAYIEHDGYDIYDTLTLYFEDNVSVKVMSEHGFFDSTLNEYVMISLENASTYLGHSFFYTSYDGENYISKTIKLLNYSIEKEYLDTYSFVTAVHYNHFVNGLLGMPAGIDGLYNIFELNSNMQYDVNSKQEDIELYGLAAYDEWSDYITYDEFIAFNGQYVNVAMGKGMITRDEIVEIIVKFLHPEIEVE